MKTMQLLKRKVDNFLACWKENPNRKPLIIKGARQIGHSFLLVIRIHFCQRSSRINNINFIFAVIIIFY